MKQCSFWKVFGQVDIWKAITIHWMLLWLFSIAREGCFNYHSCMLFKEVHSNEVHNRTFLKTGVVCRQNIWVALKQNRKYWNKNIETVHQDRYVEWTDILALHWHSLEFHFYLIIRRYFEINSNNCCTPCKIFFCFLPYASLKQVKMDHIIWLRID